MKLRILASSVVLATCFNPAQATDLNYSYVELSAFSEDVANSDIRGRGASAKISAELPQSLSFMAELENYDYTDTDNTRATLVDIGLGLHQTISTKVDLFEELRYAYVRAQSDSEYLTGDSFILGLGIRAKLTDSIEVSPKIDLYEASSSRSYSITARHHFTGDLEKFSIGLLYEGYSHSDNTFVAINTRFCF